MVVWSHSCGGTAYTEEPKYGGQSESHMIEWEVVTTSAPRPPCEVQRSAVF